MSGLKGNARKRIAAFAAIAIVVNIVAVFAIGAFEAEAVRDQLAAEVADVEQRFDEVMDGYEHSFNLFTLMVENEIGNDPDPDSVEAFLKDADKALLEAEGESYDGLYLYYKDRYLYSWDTPFSVYEESGYVATERPWYQAAVAAQGGIAFTPPYMSYANNYILSTIARLQPDGETVVAYDVKMGDIQNIAAAPSRFADGSIMIFDANGTVAPTSASSAPICIRRPRTRSGRLPRPAPMPRDRSNPRTSARRPSARRSPPRRSPRFGRSSRRDSRPSRPSRAV